MTDQVKKDLFFLLDRYFKNLSTKEEQKKITSITGKNGYGEWLKEYTKLKQEGFKETTIITKGGK